MGRLCDIRQHSNSSTDVFTLIVCTSCIFSVICCSLGLQEKVNVKKNSKKKKRTKYFCSECKRKRNRKSKSLTLTTFKPFAARNAQLCNVSQVPPGSAGVN
ncbi:hypothetical protein FKM82_005439 [Ascaphus truei]